MLNILSIREAAPPSFFIYILQLQTGQFYCGITNNLQRRYKEHSEYKKSWASKQGVVKMIWSIGVSTRGKARVIEKYIKRYGVCKFVLYLRVNNQL